jgi:ABC-type multidrug transport system fused ATPase/permease subunit
MRTALRDKVGFDDLPPGVFIVDKLQICFEDVRFTYAEEAPPVFSGLSQTLDQGTLVGIRGGPSSGKATLMELVGGVFEVSEGTIFVPPHLRVLHVSKESRIVAGTMASNIFFGIGAPGTLSPEALARGIRICERLQFSPQLLDMAKDFEREERSNLSNTLSRSDRKLVHLARALIFNPEVLVVHTPSMYFDKRQTKAAFDALCEFVHNRGMEVDPAARGNRRPRTCIFTTSSLGDLEVAQASATERITQTSWPEDAPKES